MAAENSMKMTIYRVTGKTIPWSSEMEQTVGYYSNEEAARKVVDLVRDVNKQEIPGGIDVKFQKYVSDVVRGPLGFCLKNSSEEDSTALVKETLNRDECRRIAEMRFKYDVSSI